MLNIAFDGLGGEAVAKECHVAIEIFLNDHRDACISLATTAQAFEVLREKLPESLWPRLLHLEALDRVEFDEAPVQALRKKEKTSIEVAVDAVTRGQSQAVVSFGHTGAAVVSAQLQLGLAEGVERAGLAAILPNAKGRGLLMDVGANLKCRPEHLLQYGRMADVYGRSVMGMAAPRIGLLNVGEEPGKGDDRLQQSYRLLKEKADFNFVGNVEGSQVFDGTVDAVICNGLEGNMVLKSAEALANMLFESIRERLDGEEGLSQRAKWTISSLAARHDPDSQGASRLLGVNGLVLIGHGNARREAILSALESVREELQSGLQPALMGRLSQPLI